MKSTVATAALAVCLIATPAAARDNSAYVQLAGGITAPNDSEYDSTTDSDIIGTVEWGTGYDLAASAGYDFGAFRVEGEIALKEHGFDRIVSGGTTLDDSNDLDFDFTTWSFMANVLADIGDDGGIQGFVGGGLGIASTELDLRDTRPGNNDQENDTDSSFAWQLLAGAKAPVSDGVSVGLKYRFYNQTDLSFIVSDDDDFNTDFSSHSILLFATFDF